jgi:hypothetical protein
MSEPVALNAEEAVARFFPRCHDYDHVTAQRFIRWLARCGYEIVEKEEAGARPSIKRSYAKELRS